MLYRNLFEPRSVALIGASDDPGKTTGRPLAFLQRTGFRGRIWPVNPRPFVVEGIRSVPSLKGVPEPVDHCFVLLTGAAQRAAIDDCIARAVPVLSILDGGFLEHEEGRAWFAAALSRARTAGTRILGPNSIGVVNNANGLCLTANAAFASAPFAAGRLALLSQSGSIIGSLASRAYDAGIAFSKLVSVGNEADLEFATLGELLCADPATDAILLFLETVRDGPALQRFATAAWTAGKPVLCYLLGRSAVGQRLAASHTGAMLQPSAFIDAMLRELGIVVIDNFEALFESALLFVGRRAPTAPERRPIAVVTTTGGGAAMVVDRLGLAGVAPAAPSVAVRTRLDALPTPVKSGEIVDLTLAGVRPDVVTGALDALISSREHGLVLMVVGSSARHQPEKATSPLIAFTKSPVPLAVLALPEAPAARAALNAAGIAAFRTPEACAAAIQAYMAWCTPRDLAPFRPAPAGVAPKSLDEAAAKELLARIGIATPRRQIFRPGGTGGINNLAFPVVAKVLSSDIAHKTDIGGVALDIADAQALNDALRRIAASVAAKAPAAHVEGYLVEEQATGVCELLVSFSRTRLGSFVSVGAGGIAAELSRDVQLRLAPVDEATAESMLRGLRLFPLLDGYRGRPRADVAAVRQAIVRLSRLAGEAPDVLEAEINPLVVGVEGRGATAVDALIVLAAR
ncbi:MAG: acetate--CoA ligase family protein [Alphaproteobacteria bacterium]|nr:acetate--CoA ligase family protein [Alphaproteobacteria bacterium]